MDEGNNNENSKPSYWRSMFQKVYKRNSKDVQKDDQDDVSVTSVRNYFISQLDSGVIDSTLFHPKDIEKMMRNDKFIQRYIEEHLLGNEEKITVTEIMNNIGKVLKWRKEFGINDLEPNNFPIEFFHLGMVKQATLSNGDILFCIFGRKYKIIDEWRSVLVKSVLWYYDTLEQSLEKDTKIHVIVDGSNCGMDQADFGMLFHVAPIVLNYYSTVVSRAYWYGIPWILKPGFSILLSLVPKRFKGRNFILDSNNVADLMGSENIPDFMGGPLNTYFPPIPDGMSDIESVGIANGIKRKNIDEAKRVIEHSMKMD